MKCVLKSPLNSWGQNADKHPTEHCFVYFFRQMYGDFSGSGGFGWAAKVGRFPDFDDFLGKDKVDEQKT